MLHVRPGGHHPRASTACGVIIAGDVVDIFGVESPIWVSPAISLVSGVIVLERMREALTKNV